MEDIKQEFISYNRTARSVKPQYIVIHDTGDAGATDKNEHDYFAGGDRQASADFFVDGSSITQIIDTDNYYSWHCGDGRGRYGVANSNSLGIEMCLEKDGTVSAETENSTLELVQYLMNKYGLGVDQVVRHYDASRKSCPNAWSSNSWAKWYDFKDKLASGSVCSGTWKLSPTTKKWWYDLGDGDFVQDCWKKIDGSWYLFNTDGYMEYDWKSDEGKWYYLGGANDGAMKTGWIMIYGNWYYAGTDGSMAKGWTKVEDKWYYLDPNTGAMHTGWIQDGDKWYLLYSNGSMVSNTSLYNYTFDSNGVATKNA